jgi:glycosyltransferase involved in cell wall biosynthesis
MSVAVPVTHIVITAYKKADRIERAVAIALAQVDRDVVITLVDDCSPDDTPRVLARLARQHGDRVEVVCTPTNLGAAGARNFGARRARTPLLMFLDGDDVVDRRFVGMARNVLAELELVDVVQTGIKLDRDIAPELLNRLVNSLPCNRVMRRYVFEFIGGFADHPRMRGGGEDIVFNRAARTYFNVLTYDQPLYHYDGADSIHFQRFLARAQLDEHGDLVFSHQNDQDRAIQAVSAAVMSRLKQAMRPMAAKLAGAMIPPAKFDTRDFRALTDEHTILTRGTSLAPARTDAATGAATGAATDVLHPARKPSCG